MNCLRIKITITGNHVDGFTAAELWCVNEDEEHFIGRVFEQEDGWHYDLLSSVRIGGGSTVAGYIRRRLRHEFWNSPQRHAEFSVRCKCKPFSTSWIFANNSSCDSPYSPVCGPVKSRPCSGSMWPTITSPYAKPIDDVVPFGSGNCPPNPVCVRCSLK
jgi:hypothetical protein